MRRARAHSVESTVKYSTSVVAARGRTGDAISIMLRVEWPGRAVELDDQFLVFGEVTDQAGAVTTGTVDRQRPQPAVLLDPIHQAGVAVRVRGDRERREQRAGVHCDRRGGVSGVDPDDQLDQFCQHGHCVRLTVDADGPGPVRSSAGL